MMTRKDYIEVSDILNFAIKWGYIKEDKANFIIGEFAEMFQRDNDRFNRIKFVDACFAERD